MTVDVLGNEAAKNLASRFGFKSVQNAEKFIMNMHVHRILSERINICLRGGLCTPFYVSNPKAIRLSVDLDMFVEYTRESALSKITKILRSGGMKALPRKSKFFENLLQIDLRYSTPRLLHDQKEHMKIDVMYGVNFDLPMKIIPKGHRIFSSEIGYDVVAVTRGCLIADKIATLAINGTGYMSRDKAPKQIHDIGYLLDEATISELAEATDTFKIITEFKTHNKEQGSATDVIQHVINFLISLVTIDRKMQLRRGYIDDFDKFKQEYLSNHTNYNPDELKSNILKVLLYALVTKKTVVGEMNSNNAAKTVYYAIKESDISIMEIKTEMKNLTQLLIDDKAVTVSKSVLDIETETNLRILYAIGKLGANQKHANE